MVRDRGLEPLTPSVSGRCSTTELTAQQRTGKTLPSDTVSGKRESNPTAPLIAPQSRPPRSRVRTAP